MSAREISRLREQCLPLIIIFLKKVFHNMETFRHWIDRPLLPKNNCQHKKIPNIELDAAMHFGSLQGRHWIESVVAKMMVARTDKQMHDAWQPRCWQDCQQSRNNQPITVYTNRHRLIPQCKLSSCEWAWLFAEMQSVERELINFLFFIKGQTYAFPWFVVHQKKCSLIFSDLLKYV